LNEDVPEANIDIYTTNGDLTKWAQRGVLLLNSALTVKSGDPGSHSDMWRNFTKKVIEIICTHCKTRKNKGIVFIALGKNAQEHIKDIDTTVHRVITASHPSSRARFSGAEPFAASNIFSKTNEALKELELEPIDWSL
jgi:uracil-DNA glycosylase